MMADATHERDQRRRLAPAPAAAAFFLLIAGYGCRRDPPPDLPPHCKRYLDDESLTRAEIKRKSFECAAEHYDELARRAEVGALKIDGCRPPHDLVVCDEANHPDRAYTDAEIAEAKARLIARLKASPEAEAKARLALDIVGDPKRTEDRRGEPCIACREFTQQLEENTKKRDAANRAARDADE